MLNFIIDIISGSLMLTLAFLKPLTEKVKFRYYGLLYALLFFSEIFQLKNHLSAIFIIGLALLYVVILTKNRLFNAILALFSYFLVVVSNNLLLLLLQKLFHISVEMIDTSYVIGISFNICFLALVFALTSLIGWYAKKYLHPNSFFSYKKVFSLVLIEVFLAITILIFNIDYGKRINYPNQTIIYNCILFFLYFLLSTLLLVNIVQTTRKNMEAEQKLMEYNHLLGYIKDLEQATNSLRKFRHDYLNILLSMDLMIHTRDLERLTSYFDAHIKPQGGEVAKINISFTNLAHISEPAIKGIVSHKLQMAHLHNIPVNLEILEDVSEFYMEPFDLARILGFFLDNAIEAASENLPEPFIHIAFIPMENYLTIMVENTCTPDDLPMNRLTEEGFSTKGKNRGYGLRQVAEILAAYPNVNHLMEKKQGIFTQTLELYPDLKPKA